MISAYLAITALVFWLALGLWGEHAPAFLWRILFLPLFLAGMICARVALWGGTFNKLVMETDIYER